MSAPCSLLGDGITDDTLLNIARFLPIAKDLLCLRLSNKRFNIKCIAAPDGSAGVAAAAPEMLCIAEEAGRLWVAGCSKQECGWVPRRGFESWLGLMREVELLRVPLVFGRAHADVPLSENGGGGDEACGRRPPIRGEHGGDAVGASLCTIHSGTRREHDVRRGAAGHDVEGGVIAQSVDGHCFYFTANGYPATTTGRGSSARRSRATASACCSTSIKAA